MAFTKFGFQYSGRAKGAIPINTPIKVADKDGSIIRYEKVSTQADDFVGISTLDAGDGDEFPWTDGGIVKVETTTDLTAGQRVILDFTVPAVPKVRYSAYTGTTKVWSVGIALEDAVAGQVTSIKYDKQPYLIT